MSDMDLSSTAKALLRAARADTPSEAARTRIWSGVSSGLGGVSGGASAGASSGSASGSGAGAPGNAPDGAGLAASGGAVTGAASGGAAVATLKGAGLLGGSKLLAIGALFGSTVTVGLAATLIGFGSAPRLGPDPQEAPVAALVASPSYGAGSAGWGGGRASGASGTGGTGSPAGARETTSGGAAGVGSTNAGAPMSVTPERGARASSSGAGGAAAADGSRAHGGGAVRAPRAGAAPEDALMRESALVAEARGAFMRRDYEKALAALHVTHGLVHRELEPEELSIEARALRAVGRDAEADAAEATLRSRFPDHALSR